MSDIIRPSRVQTTSSDTSVKNEHARGLQGQDMHPVIAVLICVLVVLFTYVTGLYESNAGLAVTGVICTSVVVVLMRLTIFDLLIITIPTSIYLGGGSSRVNASVSDLVLILAVVHFFASAQLRQSWRSARSVAMPVVLALLTMVVVATLPVLIWPRSEFNAQYYFLDAFKLLVVILYFFLAVAYGLQALKKEDYRFVYVWITVAVIESLLGISGSLAASVGSPNMFTYSTRAVGTFSDPNSFVAYLLPSICMVWLAFRISGNKRVLLCAIPMVIGVLLSGSRAGFLVLGMVALGIAIITLLVSQYRKALGTLLVIGCVLLYAIYAMLAGNPVIERGLSENENDIRWKLAEAAIQMWADSPIIGVGLGQFRLFSEGYLGFTNTNIAHNTYLSFLAEGGIFTAALFVFVFIFVGKSVWSASDAGKYPLLLGILSMAVMAATINLQNFRPLWMILGIALAWGIWAKNLERGQQRMSLEPEFEMRRPDPVK